MRLGIFAKTFARPTLADVLDAVQAHRLTCVQFNMACAGLSATPDVIPDSLCDEIRENAGIRHIEIAAVSGTFNMIHPDANVRRDGLKRLAELARASHRMGTSIITLCTGSRDAENMWRRHPDNGTPEAWRDLLDSMTQAIAIAESANVTLLIEPELNNVVDSAAKARRLLDEIGSPRVKVIMDAANLIPPPLVPRMREILDDAIRLLGPDIVMAHAKELGRDGRPGDLGAGQGILGFDDYLDRLNRVGFDGPVILHGLHESQVAGSVAFLKNTLDRISASRLPHEKGET